MHRYRYLIASVAAFAFGIGSASAADLGAPAPAPIYTKAPMAVPFSWTGFYLGGNVGYGPGTASNNISFSQTDTAPGNLATFGAADSVKVNGFNGGAQAGYNWQVNNFVFGLETDIQASGEKGTNTFGGVIENLSVANQGNNPAAVTDTNKLDWFGTTRARLGVAVDRWLVYGTGGAAYGEVNQSGAIQPGNAFAVVNNAPIVWNQSTTKVGWSAGAGVENAITRNWSWKVEYLYMDLGTDSAPLSGGVGKTGGLPYNCYGSTPIACNNFHNAAVGTISSHFTDNIIRLGVNYRFN